MGKKSKKRQLDADSNENKKIEAKTHVFNDTPKMKKRKIGLEKSEKQKKSNVAAEPSDFKSEDVPQKKKLQHSEEKLDANASTNVVEGKKLKKKNKKAKEQKNLGDKATPSNAKEGGIIQSNTKEKFKKKREERREKQKEQGLKKAGPFKVLEKYSLEEMKKKIAEIQSRETITKTSKRRLSVLKKKVQVLESEDGKVSLNNQDSTPPTTIKENKKNKLQNKINKNTENVTVNTNKSSKKKKEKKDEQTAKKLKKNLFVEDRVGSRVDEIEEAEEEEENKLKIENGNDSNSEEDDSKDPDFSEENIEEDSTELEHTNESSDPENDEDDSEDDESLEEADKSTSLSDTKTKHTQNKSNQDSNKQIPKQAEKDPNKKQRYVLFVGNISYDSTTDDLKKHFLNKVEAVKDVRIPLKPGTNAPRGFAYVEVEDSKDYEKALSLHNTFLNGRKINVQYTASGSKKAIRKPEIVHKNKKLQALRNEGKLAGSQKFSHKRSFRRNFKDNAQKESANREKFPHKHSFKSNFKKNFNKKESQ